MKELTRAEQQIMQILWKIGKGFVHDIIEQIPEPKPAYNTVSTIVRILEKKGFAGYTAYGKTHEYYPLVSKKEYTRTFLKHIMKDYFSGSYKELVSFFTNNDDLDIKELEDIRKMMAEEIQKQKTNK
ncbi:MAG: BlaI/MecI/CopY family transcriptional regulator [Bacteroidota bacterium]|nr:BlaI/MecI/CopY family transcriptional regulator [Bacteroidota bacterium]